MAEACGRAERSLRTDYGNSPKISRDVPVYIYDEKTRQKMKADRINWVTGEDALCEELRQLLGEKNVALKY